MLKFGQKEVTTKDFYGQRKITDVFTIYVNKFVVSDKVPCNNGKGCRYIVGYQVEEVLIPLFIKAPKNCFNYGVMQYNKNSAYTMSFSASEEKGWLSQYKKIQNEIKSQLFEKLARELIKGKYVHGKLKTWKKGIKTNFYGQIIPYDLNCNATAVLKIYFVNKQDKNVHPQTYLEECIYTDVEKQLYCMLSDDDDEGLFKV